MKTTTRKSMLACSMCLFMALSTACTSDKTTEQDNANNSDAGSVAADSSQPVNNENPSETQTESIINNKYARTETDEIDGEKLTFETSYTFLDGGAGIFCRNFDSQEVRGFTWDENKIYFCDNTSYDYTIEEDVLKIEGGAGAIEFTKKVENDPVFAGDFSEFAGIYKATEYSINGYGVLADVEVKADGTISGGYIKEYNDSDDFPDVKPICVEKLNDGSYYCILSVFPDDNDDDPDDDFADLDGWVEYGYLIYPKDAAEQFSSEPDYASDNVYVQLFACDGGVFNPNFMKAQ